ncbi:MAG TPA: VOC family protein [Terricaulis sp.]|nr:VOC family protein [Terricaulis sp.]
MRQPAPLHEYQTIGRIWAVALEFKLSLKLIQIGMNTADLPATLELFTEAFGFRNAGSQVILGSLIQIQGLDTSAHALMWWLVGAQPRLQLEFFHHTKPAQRPLRADWTPADHGWTRFGIAVEGFDRALEQMAKRGIAPIAGVVSVGGLRRCAFRDPAIGAIVEVMEDGEALRALGGRNAGPALVYASASVSDLAAARVFYGDVLQLTFAPNADLHPPKADVLWGLDGAQSESFLVNAGGVLLEIVQYRAPMGRPRAGDYRTSDQGVVNVALGARDKPPIEAAFKRLAAAGLTPPYLVDVGDLLAGYIIDAEREIELAVIPESLEAALGFAPLSPFLGASEG